MNTILDELIATHRAARICAYDEENWTQEADDALSASETRLFEFQPTSQDEHAKRAAYLASEDFLSVEFWGECHIHQLLSSMSGVAVN